MSISLFSYFFHARANIDLWITIKRAKTFFLSPCSFVVFGIAAAAALIVSCCLHFLVLFFGGTSLETVWLRMKYLVTLLLLSQNLAFSAFSTSLWNLLPISRQGSLWEAQINVCESLCENVQCLAIVWHLMCFTRFLADLFVLVPWLCFNKTTNNRDNMTTKWVGLCFE